MKRKTADVKRETADVKRETANGKREIAPKNLLHFISTRLLRQLADTVGQALA